MARAAALALFACVACASWLAACSVSPTDDGAETTSGYAATCLHLDLTASRNYKPDGFKDDNRSFSPSLTLSVPQRLTVTVGNAGSQGATLTFRRLPDKKLVRCHYNGQAKDNHPTDPSDIQRGLSYVSDWCDFDAKPNAVITTDILRLHIEGGDSDDPSHKTVATVGVDDAKCPRADAGSDAGNTNGSDARADGASDSSANAADAAEDGAPTGPGSVRLIQRIRFDKPNVRPPDPGRSRRNVWSDGLT